MKPKPALTYLPGPAGLLDYSMGSVALHTAFRHPLFVHKLVVVSEPTRRDGWYLEVVSILEYMVRLGRYRGRY